MVKEKRIPDSRRPTETGETAAPSGAAAANLIGLTTQNPTVNVYRTSGRSRSLSFGKQMVELKHALRWMLQRPSEKSGHAVRALAWIGAAHAREAVMRLRSCLYVQEKRELLAMRPLAPGWMAKELSALAV